MIRPEELRIGNLLRWRISERFDWEIAPVFRIQEVGIPFEVGYSQGKLASSYMCEPIPITEEWLLKAGFAKSIINEKKEIRFYKNNQITEGSTLGLILNICENGSYGISAYTDIHEEILFVHQLQNIYFALTGEELKFNL